MGSPEIGLTPSELKRRSADGLSTEMVGLSTEKILRQSNRRISGASNRTIGFDQAHPPRAGQSQKPRCSPAGVSFVWIDQKTIRSTCRKHLLWTVRRIKSA